jgi:tRNA(fMet)-specific endonuclease VapC
MAKNQIILIETSVWIELIRRNSLTITQLQQIGEANFAINSIIKAELYRGARNKTELKKLKSTFGKMSNYLLTEQIARKFEELILTYGISHRIGIADALIVSTAIVNSLEFFTYNVADFDFIPDLKLYQIK